MTQQVFTDSQLTVRILYTNYRGETAWRTIVPRCLTFAASEWHPEHQWVLKAFDVEKGAARDFVMKDIKEWRVGTP